MRLLDEKLRALARSLEPTEEEKQSQRRALEAVRAVLLKRWPGARLSVFGSVASGMQVTRSNDLDLTLELDDVADDDAAGKGRAVEEAAAALEEANDEEAEKEGRGGKEEARGDKKEDIKEERSKKGDGGGGSGGGGGSVSSPSSVLFDSILPLPRARVPVLKFRHVPTGTKVDVTINNRLALHNTRRVFFFFFFFGFWFYFGDEFFLGLTKKGKKKKTSHFFLHPSKKKNRLLKTYASLDGGRLRALVACVKHWAKRRAVNDPYR